MAKFLTGSALRSALKKILGDAQEEIVLISPYVKLKTAWDLKALTEHLTWNLSPAWALPKAFYIQYIYVY